MTCWTGSASPRAPTRSDHGDGTCHTTSSVRDTVGCESGPADRRAGSSHLRRTTILEAYESDEVDGHERKHVAFALALILDELARHLRDLDEHLRVKILDCCRPLLGQPAS